MRHFTMPYPDLDKATFEANAASYLKHKLKH